MLLTDSMSAALSDLFLYHVVTIVFSHRAGPLSNIQCLRAINGFSQEDEKEKEANRREEGSSFVSERHGGDRPTSSIVLLIFVRLFKGPTKSSELSSS